MKTHLIMINPKKIPLTILFIVFAITACNEDWLDLSPSTSVSTNSAFTSADDVLSVLNGAYSIMQHPYYYGGAMCWYPEVTGEDMRPLDVSARTSTAHRFQYSEDNIDVYFWKLPYQVIVAVNSILDHIDDITAATEEEKTILQDYKGQALALRALCLFDLTRLFGLPYLKNNGDSLGAVIATHVLSPSEELSRSSVAECYSQIISDFLEAIELLPETKTDGKINQHAAQSLLARVYLYQGDNTNAMNMAEAVIGSGSYALLDTSSYVAAWGSGFSSESIFEIVQNSDDNGGHECIGYYLFPDGYGCMLLTDAYINLLQEDEHDVRANLLTDFYYSSGSKTDTIKDAYLLKYPGKDGAEVSVNNNIVIRLSEVYLIAAEAAYKTSDTDKALAYLNTLIENRNGKANSLDLSELTYERIFNERRKELVCEGHRFFDALRDGKTLTRDYEGFFGEVGNIHWNDHRIVLPIPIEEINANANIRQNKGY